MFCVEAVNENAFKYASMKEKVDVRLKELFEQGKIVSASIPLQPELCGTHLTGRFDDEVEAEMVLNPVCLDLYKKSGVRPLQQLKVPN
jgi:hypothetical protein